MKKTVSELLTFKNQVVLYASFAKKDEITKLHKKLKRQLEAIAESLKKHEKDVEDEKINYCSEDNKGNMILDDKGNYTYTKANLKLLRISLETMDKKEVDVEITLKEEDFKDCDEPFKTTFSEFITPKQIEQVEKKVTQQEE
jgi:hypothetical protein